MKPEPIILDIETAPLPREVLLEISPCFEAASNLKDPEKIAASIAEKEQAWYGQSALKAERGRILAIGVMSGKKVTVLEGLEREILDKAWSWVKKTKSGRPLVGHNIVGFDLPWMVRRSWGLAIPVPDFVLEDLGKYRCPDWVKDTMLMWRFQDRQELISLDTLAWHCKVGRKNGSGKDFAMLYMMDREKALDYLRNDLKLTKDVYLAMSKKSSTRVTTKQHGQTTFEHDPSMP